MLIKDICKINPPRKSKYNSYINYIDTSSVFDGKLLNTQFLTNNFPSRAQREININDILISSVRPNLKHNFFVNININNHIASTGFIQIRLTNNNFVPRFIYYYLTSNKNISLYSSIADTSQTTFPSFNKDVIENLSVPNVPYSEQLHIVDIIAYLIFLLLSLLIHNSLSIFLLILLKQL